MKYKIGDRVRVRLQHYPAEEDTVVVDVSESDNTPYLVEYKYGWIGDGSHNTLRDRRYWWVLESELEPQEPVIFKKKRNKKHTLKIV